MSVVGGWLDMSAWDAADVSWYADLVAHAQGQWCAPSEGHDVLKALNQRPWKDCLLMKGAHLDGRYEDTNHQLWSDDRKGRWSSKVAGQKVYLHHRIAQLQPSRARRDGDVVSHVCGNCECIRLEHIRYQTPAEDILDRRHCSKRQRREIRPDSTIHTHAECSVAAAGSPQLTPQQPARYRSPATSRDLP